MLYIYFPVILAFANHYKDVIYQKQHLGFNEYMNVQMAAVFQDFVVFSFSIRENVAIGDFNKLHHDWTIREALHFSNFIHPQYLESDNIDLYMNKNFELDGIELSGGQRQKLAISRAVIRESELLIVDEPTASLDPLAESEILKIDASKACPSGKNRPSAAAAIGAWSDAMTEWQGIVHVRDNYHRRRSQILQEDVRTPSSACQFHDDGDPSAAGYEVRGYEQSVSRSQFHQDAKAGCGKPYPAYCDRRELVYKCSQTI